MAIYNLGGVPGPAPVGAHGLGGHGGLQPHPAAPVPVIPPAHGGAGIPPAHGGAGIPPAHGLGGHGGLLPHPAAPVPVIPPAHGGAEPPMELLTQNQLLRDQKRKLAQQVTDLNQALNTATANNRPINKSAWKVITLGYGQYYQQLEQQIHELNQRITERRQEIDAINRVLSMGTADKTDRVKVLVLQETCKDLEEKINEAKVTIRNRDIRIQPVDTFNFREIHQGTNNARTANLQAQINVLNQAYAERERKWAAIGTLSA